MLQISQVNTTSISHQTTQKYTPLSNIQNQSLEAQKQNGIKTDSKLGSSFLLSPIKEIEVPQEEVKLQGAFGQLNLLQIDRQRNNNIDNEDCNDIEPLIFDIEEIEFRMNDVNEISKSDDGLMTRSIRGSIIHTPKDFPIITPSGKISESQMSSQSYIEPYDVFQYKNFQDFLKYDTGRNLDISMSSVCSTPRQINMDLFEENSDLQSPSQYLQKQQQQKSLENLINSYRFLNQHNDKKIDEEGQINQKLLDIGMSPKLYQQNSSSSQRLNDSYSLYQSNNISAKENRAYSTSERSNVIIQSQQQIVGLNQIISRDFRN